MADGWIKLHRRILSNPVIWRSSEPYDGRSAFIELILTANHEPADIRINNRLIHIERGQTWTSYRKLAERWRWSINKVRRYIKCLVHDSMLTLEPHTDGTLITIVNYDFYQGAGHTTEHADGTPTERSQIRGRITNKNIKNDNNDNKCNIKRETQLDMFDRLVVGRALNRDTIEALKEWIKYKSERNDRYKETGMTALISQAVSYTASYGASAVIDLINISMANHYKGIVWDKIKNPDKTKPPERSYNMDELELKLLATN